ncbi:unnamed protein product [Periconia digitata]|uniref:Uncharacterized protein n=1 Tax=Periconia digitata TaxID=1303443 RepID=A0A9W4UQD7_9PLEO|nr:unnamed protein product [Periconia digitata]
MGNNCSSKCKLCYGMCIFFPIGTCLLCQSDAKATIDDNSTSREKQLSEFTTDELLAVYHAMTVLHDPPMLCGQLVGEYDTAAQSCTINLAYSDDFLSFVKDLDTPQQLCAEVEGHFEVTTCTLNATTWGQGSLEAKANACAVHGGQWAGTGCALLG